MIFRRHCNAEETRQASRVFRKIRPAAPFGGVFRRGRIHASRPAFRGRSHRRRRGVPERPLRGWSRPGGMRMRRGQPQGVVPTIRAAPSPGPQRGARMRPLRNHRRPRLCRGRIYASRAVFHQWRRGRFPNDPYGDGRPWMMKGRRDNPLWLSPHSRRLRGAGSPVHPPRGRRVNSGGRDARGGPPGRAGRSGLSGRAGRTRPPRRRAGRSWRGSPPLSAPLGSARWGA